MKTHSRNFLSAAFEAAMVVFTVVFFARKLLACTTYDVRHGFWNLSSWMVDWSGGYVRRGLMGTCLRKFCEVTSLDPIAVAYVAGIAAWVGLLMWFMRRFIERSWPWWIVPLGVFMGGAPVVRTDALLMLMQVAMFYAVFRSRKSFAVRMIAANAIGVAAINIHEMFFVFAVPALAVLMLFEEGFSRKGFLRIAAFAPMCIAFLATAVWHGNAAVRDTIAASWEAFRPDEFAAAAPVGEIGAMALKIGDVWGWVRDTVVFYPSLGPVPGWIFCPCVVLVLLWALPVAISRDCKSPLLATFIMIFQGAMLTPMTIVFCDVSRLCFFWVSSSFIVLLFAIGCKRVNETIAGFAAGKHCIVGGGGRIIALTILLMAGLPRNNISAYEGFRVSAVGTFLVTAKAVITGVWDGFALPRQVP
ncbi:MAG: hypothetical protein IJ802_02605 [Kiritimatiellae bacterium]|nr:hypothetical protein [Kiritimatiellia bacterium]